MHRASPGSLPPLWQNGSWSSARRVHGRADRGASGGAGVRPVLAGRSEARLEALVRASRRAGVVARRRDAREHGLRSGRGPADVLDLDRRAVLEVGPAGGAGRRGRGVHVLDTTGEPEFIRRVFDGVRAAGVALGRGVADRDGLRVRARRRWRARWRLDEAGEDAVRVDVGYYALGGGPTRCRRARASRSWRRRWATGIAYRDGAWRPCVRPSACGRSRWRASRVRRSRSAAPSTSRCPRRSGGCARSTCTWGGSGRWRGRSRRARSRGRGSGACRACGRRCGSRASARGVARRRSEPGRGRGRGSRPRRSTRPDARSPTVNLAGVDGYEFTASFVAWAAQQDVSGVGALGPVEAFGLDGVGGGRAARGARARALSAGPPARRRDGYGLHRGRRGRRRRGVPPVRASRRVGPVTHRHGPARCACCVTHGHRGGRHPLAYRRAGGPATSLTGAVTAP